jgi:hypothetical protein
MIACVQQRKAAEHSTGDQQWEQQQQQHGHCSLGKGSTGSSCHSPPKLFLLSQQ